MKIHFGWSWKVMEKSWETIFLKEWSPCFHPFLYSPSLILSISSPQPPLFPLPFSCPLFLPLKVQLARRRGGLKEREQ